MENIDNFKKANKLRSKKKVSQVNKLNTCSYFGIFDCTCCKLVNNNNKSSSSCENKISDCTIKNEPSAFSVENEESRTPLGAPDILEKLRNEPSTSTSKDTIKSIMKEHEKGFLKMINSELEASSSTDLPDLREVDREDEEIDVVNGSLEDVNLFQMTENRAKTIDITEQHLSNQVNTANTAVLENDHEEIDVVSLNDGPSASNSVKRSLQVDNELEEEIDVVNLSTSEQNQQTDNITSTVTSKPKRKKLNSNMSSAEDEVIDVVNLTEDSQPDLAPLSNMLVNSNRELRSNRKQRNNEVIDLINSTIIEITDSPVAPRVISGVINIDDDETPQKSSSIKLNWGTCPVCFEHLEPGQVMSTMCGHVFCESCIKTVIKTAKKCPKCRKSLTMKMIHHLFF